MFSMTLAKHEPTVKIGQVGSSLNFGVGFNFIAVPVVSRSLALVPGAPEIHEREPLVRAFARTSSVVIVIRVTIPSPLTNRLL